MKILMCNITSLFEKKKNIFFYESVMSSHNKINSSLIILFVPLISGINLF